MRVEPLKDYMELHVPYQYVMNGFHNETLDNCCVVLVGSAGRSDRNTGSILLQFLVRSSDPELAEETAFLIYNHLNNKTDYLIGSVRIIVSRGQQAVPMYTGTDEKNRHIYSVNIEALMDK